MRYVWPALYVLSVVAVNVGFSVFPPIQTAYGKFAPMALVVGATFVIRDFAQRSAGDKAILFYMLVGIVLSYIMADPFVATASAAAFAVSELVDYAVYTWTKRPFHQRVLISSAISTPVDTFVFLTGVGIVSAGTFFIMVASKMVAALLLYLIYREIQVDRDSRTMYPYSEAKFESDWEDDTSDPENKPKKISPVIGRSLGG